MINVLLYLISFELQILVVNTILLYNVILVANSSFNGILF